MSDYLRAITSGTLTVRKGRVVQAQGLVDTIGYCVPRPRFGIALLVNRDIDDERLDHGCLPR